MRRRVRGQDETAAASAPPAARRASLAGHGALLAVLAVLVLVAVVRWRLLDLPLERDEGEYAYAGQLILQGVPPYLQAYNMKFPGTYYAYALAMACFGETPRGIRLGLLLVNAGTALLLFALGRRLLGALGGAIAAIAFALLTLDLWSMSLFAHATHFVLLPALAGLYLLIRAPAERRTPWLLAAGALLGLALLMKQHAFAFPLLGAFLLVVEGRGRARRGVVADVAALATGAAAAFVVMASVLWAQGVLDRFWFWTFEYALAYVTQQPASQFLGSLWGFFRDAIQGTWALWLCAGAGLVALWSDRWLWCSRLWTTGLLVAAFGAVSLGGLFRPHYFIMMMPAAALLTGVAFASAARLLERAVPAWVARTVAVVLFAAVAVAVVAGPRGILQAPAPRQMLQSRYGSCPFAEAEEVARFIAAHSRPGERIAVLGSEPEIYFYARRRSATGYLYMYPLIEDHPLAARMRDEMRSEIEAARPAYVVFVQESSTWNLTPASDFSILRWASRYVADGYRLVGVVAMFAEGSRAVWGDGARAYRPSSPGVIYVYERNGDGSTPPAGTPRVAGGGPAGSP